MPYPEEGTVEKMLLGMELASSGIKRSCNHLADIFGPRTWSQHEAGTWVRSSRAMRCPRFGRRAVSVRGKPVLYLDFNARDP